LRIFRCLKRKYQVELFPEANLFAIIHIMVENVMEKIVSLSKRRGFVYPGSEIYGGLANTYDYGPMGVELLINIKNLWWKKFVRERSDIVGIDASLISHHRIWEASGHTANFADALLDCKKCKHRIRADHLIEDWLDTNADKISYKKSEHITEGEFKKAVELKKVEGWTPEKMEEFINGYKIPCPKCGSSTWTSIRKFNQLFGVQLGLVEGEEGSGYLRGETAQGMFINFRNVVDSTRVRLPFGIAQMGKSFRNEITPGNFIQRTIEFEQAEIEYFFDPEKTLWEKLFEEWKEKMWNFVIWDLGIDERNLRWRAHSDQERSFYSKRTEDLEYNFPFGFKELWGLAYRTDYDLKQHMQFSGKDLSITDPYTQRKIIPHVIEPAVGINRLLLMVLVDAYTEIDDRVVLSLHPKLAPYKVAVFPLLANKEELVKKARGIYESLQPHMTVAWDDRGNIGKRYLYQDEIGTPWCVTVDFQTLEDETVTVRDRDTAEQERIKISELSTFFEAKLA
jgi:glycyl-tRNA synthetase